MLDGGLRKLGVCKKGFPGRPLISIVMAVLNRAGCVETLINSVLEQSYDNVELVVVDGGSTDGTLEILKRYSDRIDYWISEPDSGIYAGLNKGISLAAGDWINIQGSDDRLLDSLHIVAPHLSNDQTVYYGDLNLLYRGRCRGWGRLSSYKAVRLRMSHHAVFFPKKFFREYRYDEQYVISADAVLLIQSFAEKKFRFHYLPVVVADFDDAHGASARIFDDRFYADRFRICSELYPKYLVSFVRVRQAVVDTVYSLGIARLIKKTMNLLFRSGYCLDPPFRSNRHGKKVDVC